MKTTIPSVPSCITRRPRSGPSRRETTVFEAIKLMAEKNIGALLVMAGGRLAGVFTERDYTRKIALHGKNSRDTHVWEIMPKEIVTVDARRFRGRLHEADDRKPRAPSAGHGRQEQSSASFPSATS